MQNQGEEDSTQKIHRTIETTEKEKEDVKIAR